MRALVQRVSRAKVTIDENVRGEVQQGLLVFLGVGKNDTEEEAAWLAKKVTDLRIFSDDAGKMNRSVQDIQGGVLVVSQFTLHADVRKGTRPSFINAADPETGKRLYEGFIQRIEQSGVTTVSGEFGAMMDVELVNDGPVTIWLTSPAEREEG